MLVRWSDQDDKSNWVPAADTTAGEVVLTDGTKIIGAKRSKNAINIWTDNSLWTMAFVGPPFTFRFTQAGSNCGMVGPHAGIDFNGVTYWMGFGNFYRFSGQVETLPCTVRRFIFDDINQNYYTKVYAGTNSEFNEIIWLYLQAMERSVINMLSTILLIIIGYTVLCFLLLLLIKKYLEIPSQQALRRQVIIFITMSLSLYLLVLIMKH